MKKIIGLIIVIMAITSCNESNEVNKLTLQSPSKNINLIFYLSADGTPTYQVRYQDFIVIDTSKLGFEFKDSPPLVDGLEILGSQLISKNDTWKMPWGEQSEVVDNFNELVVYLKEKVAPGRLINVYFRAYDDGIGFRYEFPQQEAMDEVIIMDENTQFKLTGDHACWWIPGDWDIYEHLYNTTMFSEIDAISKRDHASLAQTHIPENAVNTPVTMRTKDGIHLSFHEANLTDYTGMTLKIDTENLMMQSELVGSDRLGYKVKRKLPFFTPWRTIQISENAKGLIESKLIINLNEPNKLGDIDWFKPMKYTGIWWEMHLGKSSWDYASGKHGATTKNAKRFIDFSAKNNIGGVLVEGWNTGWENWIGFDDREGIFDFITPYSDYDLEEVVRYAKDKGVEIIMHHETSAAPRTYEKQLDSAFVLMKKLGIHSVKTGYVGRIIPEGEYHHGQWMVNHYRKVLETAAKYDIAINAHEPIKATGIRRTFPNAISREGLRGQEFNAWSADGGNPPEHLPIVAFTRMLAGPIDYTPGIFNIKLEPYKENNQVNTTVAHQLALYVVIYSPLQMVADLIEHYEDQSGFQFIRDVGVDWEKTVVLDGEVGDFVIIAREEKNTGNWFLGAITDENERTLNISFDFLDKSKEYKATIYKDGSDAHWNENPTSLDIDEVKVTASSKMEIWCASGGGVAISIFEVQ